MRVANRGWRLCVGFASEAKALLRLPGVNDTRTYVVMEEVKQSNRLVIKTR